MRPTLSSQIVKLLSAPEIIRAFGIPANAAAAFEPQSTQALNGPAILTKEQIEVVAKADKIDDLAIVVGDALPLSASGALSTLTRLAPTVEDALRVLAKYTGLLVPFLHPSISKRAGDDALEIRLDFIGNLTAAAERLVTIAMLIVAAKELRNLTSQSANEIQLYFDRKLEWNLDKIVAHTSTPNIMLADFSGMIVPRGLALVKIATADPITFDELLKELDADLEQGSTSATIRQIVKRTLPTMPSVTEMASHLKITPRQLTYALRKENTTYQNLARECRTDLAQRLLRQEPKLRIEDIARVVGYSDIAAFSQAFKAWTGRSPSEFRQR